MSKKKREHQTFDRMAQERVSLNKKHFLVCNNHHNLKYFKLKKHQSLINAYERAENTHAPL